MDYEILALGDSASFPDSHPLLANAARRGEVLLVLGNRTAEALERVRDLVVLHRLASTRKAHRSQPVGLKESPSPPGTRRHFCTIRRSAAAGNCEGSTYNGMLSPSGDFPVPSTFTVLSSASTRV